MFSNLDILRLGLIPQVSTEELPKSVDSGDFLKNESSVDPFTWPLDNFAQSTSTFTKVTTLPSRFGNVMVLLVYSLIMGANMMCC